MTCACSSWREWRECQIDEDRENRRFLGRCTHTHRHPFPRERIAQGTVRAGSDEKRKKVERLETRDFRSRGTAPTRGWKRTHERKRDSARFISLYIVHCNYNLYLLVIDTFIDRLLLLLVASVISQAQISETGESRETLFSPPSSSPPPRV